MARIWKLTVELRTVDSLSEELEFAVNEKIRTAHERQVCNLLVGHTVDDQAVGDLQQILDDCVWSALSRTVGTNPRLFS